MAQRSWTARVFAVTVIGALLTPAAVGAGQPRWAALEGVIRGVDRNPVAGARLLAAQAGDGQAAERVHRSEATSAGGEFVLEELPPGTYELAVEVEGGVYLVESPLYLVAGVRRSVQIAVGHSLPAGADGAPGKAAGEPRASLWNNPFSAGAIVLGIAVLAGVLVKQATDDEVNATNK